MPEPDQSIQSTSSEILSIPIVEEIGGWGFNLRMLMDKLQGFTGKDIEVPLNTYGGEVFEGLAIYNALLARPERVTFKVVGYAMSMGSAIMMAGDRRELPKQGYVMIHNPAIMAYGDAQDMEATRALLETMTSSMAEIYSAGTGLSKDRILEMMEAETWLTSAEAKEMGFVTKITTGASIQAKLTRDQLEMYNNVPAELYDSNIYPVMNFNDKVLAALNTIADRLEAKPKAEGGTLRPQTETGEDGADDVEEEKTTSPAPPENNQEGGSGAVDGDQTQEEAQDTGEEEEGTDQLLEVLTKLGEAIPALQEQVTKLEERVTTLAGSQSAMAKKVGKLAAGNAHPEGGNGNVPDSASTERAFKKKAQAIRPNNEVKHNDK